MFFEKFAAFASQIETKVIDYSISAVKRYRSKQRNDFETQIRTFNDMYKLGNREKPQLPTPEKFEAFLRIFKKEVVEGDEWLELYRNRLEEHAGKLPDHVKLELLGKLLDWRGDCVVYQWTAAFQEGLPMGDGLDIIMQSNESKLGADGKPIYDADGKVEKGPNYWKPEDRLEELLADKLFS